MRSMSRVLLALIVTLFALAAPVSAARASTPTIYLALGDSLANGEQADGSVHHGYAEDLATTLGLSLVNDGCSGGETSTTFLDGGICTYPGAGSQMQAAEQFLAAHSGQIALITLDVGADDYGPCYTAGTLNPVCLATASAAVATNLPQILNNLRTAAPGVPIAAINYYDPYLASWTSGLTGELTADATVPLITTFNTAETAIYTAHGVTVADVADAFQTTNLLQFTTYQGQSVPVDVEQVCTLTTACTENNIHPNPAGYQLIANTLNAAL